MREDHERPREDVVPGERSPEGDQAARPLSEQEHLAALRRVREARVAKTLAVLAIVVVLVIFVIANSQPVKVNFVFVTRHPRLIWVMFACAVLGGIAGFLIGRPGKQVRPRRQRKDEQKRP